MAVADALELRDVTAFRGISARDLEALQRCSSVRSFHPGEELLQAGQRCPGLFMLRSGAVAAVVADASGAERDVGTLSSGDPAGEMALLTGEACSATFRAVTDGEAWFTG